MFPKCLQPKYVVRAVHKGSILMNIHSTFVHLEFTKKNSSCLCIETKLHTGGGSPKITQVSSTVICLVQEQDKDDSIVSHHLCWLICPLPSSCKLQWSDICYFGTCLIKLAKRFAQTPSPTQSQNQKLVPKL